MNDLIFISLLCVALVHIFEEYVYPGGFAGALKNLIPKAAHLFTPGFHVIVNGLFLLLCLSSAIIAKANLVFSLSVFSLIFMNALLHIRGTIVTKSYYPGVISAILLYIPLAIFAYSVFLVSRELTWFEGIFSVLLGMLYMGVLMCYVLFSQQDR